jgi:hypothetical protein
VVKDLRTTAGILRFAQDDTFPFFCEDLHEGTE